MGGYVVESTDDIEPDAYDKVRQKEIDNVMITYPDDATLQARGKYSTLASERRDLLKAMSDVLRDLSSYAGKALRLPDDVGFISLQLDSISVGVDRLKELNARYSVIRRSLNELKPSAWGEKNSHE